VLLDALLHVKQSNLEDSAVFCKVHLLLQIPRGNPVTLHYELGKSRRHGLRVHYWQQARLRSIPISTGANTKECSL
jgi:hypothetical protein